MKHNKKSPEAEEDVEPLSLSEKRELQRRIDDLDDPVRYVVFSDVGGYGRWRLWLDVSSDCYGMSIDQATLFKREHVARSVAKTYSEHKQNGLLIAKIRVKNGKRQVLKYEKAKPRTTALTMRR